MHTVLEDIESSSVGSYSYRFGQFVLDPRRRTLSRADSPVFLTPKAFDVLCFLVQNPNRAVTKEELLQAVWGDTFAGNLALDVMPASIGDKSPLRLLSSFENPVPHPCIARISH
jgi:DNA-binding response OmpR family regulator